MLIPLLLSLSTPTWAQDAETSDPPTETETPAEEAPPPAPPADAGPVANPPPGEAEGPAAAPPPGPVSAPEAPQRHHRSGRMGAKPACQTWEVAVWNPKKAGCAANPDAGADEWCALPAGVVPVTTVGDSYKWWVKRCADPKPETQVPPNAPR